MNKSLRAIPPISDVALAAGASLFALALYAYTVAPGLTWAHAGADGGDLIAASYLGGVPHPSGYPTYCLLGRLFALLPLGAVAHRYNLFSAFCAALAVGLLCHTALAWVKRREGGSAPWGRALAVGAALALAVSPLWWSQALIAEVYALHALGCALTLRLALALEADSPGWRWALLGLACGLALGNHLTFIWWLAGLAVWLAPQARWRSLAWAGAGLALGLAVHLYLPLAARAQPAVSWGDVHDWPSFWWLVSGQLYHGYLTGLPVGQFVPRLADGLRAWLAQFTPIGLGFALVGWGAAWRIPGARRWAAASTVAGALTALHALLYSSADSYVYLLPVFYLTALWLALGVRRVLTTHLTGRIWRSAALAILGGLVGWALARHGPALSLRADREAEIWGRTVLTDAPERALVITGQDRHTFALSYLFYVAKLRPDLILVDGELWAQPWYARQVLRRAPELAGLSAEADLGQLLAAAQAQRPVCLTSARPELEGAYRVMERGAIRCLAPQ